MFHLVKPSLFKFLWIFIIIIYSRSERGVFFFWPIILNKFKSGAIIISNKKTYIEDFCIWREPENSRNRHSPTHTQNISVSLFLCNSPTNFEKQNKMWQRTFGKNDVESGATQPLYPMMLESPELRWNFIRKVYSIVAIQLILTVIIGSIVVSVESISTFFTTTGAGLFFYVLLIITPLIGTLYMIALYEKYILEWN